MDLISSRAGQLGIDPKAAEALAGGVLGQLKAGLPPEQGAAVEQQVPEMAAWEQSAGQAQTGAAGMLGGLLGQLSGNANAGNLLALVGSLGITPEKITAAMPMIMQFVQTRLPGPLAEQLLGALPGRLGGAGAAPATTPSDAPGGADPADLLKGALGGLFGR